jgi:hypothetical protein
MAEQQKALAGFILIKDPLGTYRLIDDAWSSLDVRMSLSQTITAANLNTVTPQMILDNLTHRGTIPDYYRGRLFAKESLKIARPPPLILTTSIYGSTKTPKPDPSLSTVATQVLRVRGCVGCHAVPGIEESELSQVGPNLAHVGSRKTKEQIQKAIVEPDSPVMPKGYGQILTPEELRSVVEYLSKQY